MSGHDHSEGAPWGHGHWVGRVRPCGGYRLLYAACPPEWHVVIAPFEWRGSRRTTKLSAYEEAGVASYWLVDPDPENPSLHALDLVDGHYVEVGCPPGDRAWQAQRPFPVTVRPADLVAGLRRG